MAVGYTGISFWATICKTVRPVLTDHCLSVPFACLSVALVYCGQTVGWIKMKLGTEAGHSHIVLDGDPAPPKRGTAPIFGPYLLWPNG